MGAALVRWRDSFDIPIHTNSSKKMAKSNIDLNFFSLAFSGRHTLTH